MIKHNTHMYGVPGAAWAGWLNNHLGRAELCFKNFLQDSFPERKRDARKQLTLKEYGDRKVAEAA